MISTGNHGGSTWGTEFISVPADDPVFKSVHEKRRTPEGRKELHESGVSMKGYKRGKGQYSSVPFTERRFVSWDGEGVNDENGSHHYVLFGNSDGDYVESTSLNTASILSLITDKADIDAIHFGFAFSYDVNMILKDLSRNHLKILKEKGHVLWQRWRIEYLPRKWFLVTDRYIHKSVRIWDVWSFFMCSAVKAWKTYGVAVSNAVIEGKQRRGDSTQTRDEMFRYWKEENDAYVKLMNKLRHALHSAGLFISAWHGPGAIASHSLKKHNMSRAMANVTDEIREASQYAYGGGRFELFVVGRANCKVYEYDINSAYPYAIAQLPNLSKGYWQHVKNVSEIARFAVYRIKFGVNPFQSANFHKPMPFFHRDKRGQVSFPCVNETWVWSPELWGKQNFPGLEIIEGWEFIEETNDKPFAWLAENYEIRKRYKMEGNPAQLALKLQMNSMYGKMAQRVGWNETKRTAPKWHQLEWAGWVTAYCRAMVFRAGLYAGNSLVAFETDAVFSTSRIAEHLDIGNSLGQWEETIYDDFVYLQSGCRFGLKDGEWQSKYRGFDQGSISLEETLSVLEGPCEDWIVTGKTSRFIGFAQALHTDFSSWRSFESEKPRELRIGGEGKRRHVSKTCPACRDSIPASTGFHRCALAVPVGGMSEKHTLPWVDAELLLTQTAADEERWTVNE